MKKIRTYSITFTLGYLFLVFCSSCVSSKKLVYFNNILNDTTTKIGTSAPSDRIKANDILQISFSSLDVQTMAIFNSTSPTGGSSVTSSAAASTGYLVDEAGNITLPLIGVIKAIGHTKTELASLITNQLVAQKIAINPIIIVRIASFKIVVLGEVGHPGVIPIPSERVTILEAIGLAGDLTPYGRRDKVTLIRENDGKRSFKHLSLNGSQMFDKDFYYLQDGDIIYVEPTDAKAALSDRNTQLLPVLIGLTSLVIILISTLKK